MRQWYRFENKAADVAHLYIFDEIGQSFWNDQAVTAQQFVADLKAIAVGVKTIQLHVNSPGGSVFDAVTIANALRAQRTERGRTVDVRIEGLAASAATIVTSAGAPIRMADNAIFMVHDPHALTVGTATDHRSMADALDKVRDAIVATYRWTSRLSEDELRGLMRDETWLSATEALAKGFVTEVTDSAEEIAAHWSPKVFARYRPAPARFAAQLAGLMRHETPALAPADIAKLCSAAGCAGLVAPLVDAHATADVVRERISWARDVKALCREFADLADIFIANGTPLQAVRTVVLTLRARLDGGFEIDSSISPDGGAPRGSTINYSAVYAARNTPTRSDAVTK